MAFSAGGAIRCGVCTAEPQCRSDILKGPTGSGTAPDDNSSDLGIASTVHVVPGNDAPVATITPRQGAQRPVLKRDDPGLLVRRREFDG